MIEVKGLTKKYGNHVAVDNLSFTVEDGIIYGFLGPNGAGKSTTMNILTGYLAATEGTVTINGYDILNNSIEAKKEIGYLPEFPPLYQDMTVTEYLDFVAQLKKVSKADRKTNVEQAIEKTMIADVKDRLIRNLSKGYKQRVGLAQALIGNPSVIILDEPSVGLDPLQIIEMRELIKSLKGDHTVILSSHILSEISAVCDKIMIIRKGKLIALDTPEGLKEKAGAGKKLELMLASAGQDVNALLSGISGVDAIEVTALEGSDHVKAVIKFAGEEDPSKDVFFACAQAGIAILSMNVVEESLEDVFLDLTYSEPAKEESEATKDDEADTTENKEESDENKENEEEEK